MSINHSTVGVIGAGSFGTAVARLLAYNVPVLLYTRNAATVQKINQTHRHLDVELSEKIVATNDLKQMANDCKLLFPIVPSSSFRAMMQELAPFLSPAHFLIHGTKGFDLEDADREVDQLSHQQVQTMSQIILRESNVIRVGCLSGPNLAAEIMEGQPAATIIGSQFQEVIEMGKEVLSSRSFNVMGTHDIRGAEVAGALKNVVAIASGLLKGMGLGKNIQAVLVTKGLQEMMIFGEAMGADKDSFLNVAGIGDLFATTTSKKSRNYTFGYRLGMGETIEAIEATSEELAEGTRTVVICKQLSSYYQLEVPLFDALYDIIKKGADKVKTIHALMNL